MDRIAHTRPGGANPASVPRMRKIIVCVFLLAATLIVCGTQNRKVGFESGHHGWVSAHGLAIFSKAAWENAFVGFTMAFRDEEGQARYFYFDRAPVFLSVFFNGVLRLAERLSAKVYAARQVMNLFFLATLFVAYRLMHRLTDNRFLALSVTLLTFSNPYLLYYKDMIHFDQPTLLSMLILIYAITLYHLEGRRRFLFGTVVLSSALGRGYIPFSILVLWLLLEAYRTASQPGLALQKRLRSLAGHDALKALALALLLGMTFLAYNISVEAIRNEVPFSETGIIASAQRRLSLDEDFNAQRAHILAWDVYLLQQAERITDWTIPVQLPVSSIWKPFAAFPILLCILLHLRLVNVETRMVHILLLLTGAFLIFPGRNFAAFHDFSAMYYLGIPLLFYKSILCRLRLVTWRSVFLPILALALFTMANRHANRVHTRRAEMVNVYTYDFERIARRVRGPNRNIHAHGGWRGLVPGVPYALGFYLPEHFVSPLALADYVISTDTTYLPASLTPRNTKYHLFRLHPAVRDKLTQP